MRRQSNIAWTLIGLILVSSACSLKAPVRLSATLTAEPIIETTLSPDADALRLWKDRDASVTANRLGKGVAYAMALSPDGKTIAVTGLVSVSTYDFNSLEEIWTSVLQPKQPPGPTDRGQVLWSPDSSQLATVSEAGITIWDAKTGEQSAFFEEYAYSSVTSVAWMADGKAAVLEYVQNGVSFRDLETGEELSNIELSAAPGASDFSYREKLLAWALSDRGIVVWDTDSKQELYSPLTACEGYCVNSLKLSPDGKRVAVAATDERDQISVWDLKTGKKLFTTQAPENYAGTMFAWSPDGQFLAAAFGNGQIFVWDTGKGSQVQVLSVDKVRGLSWSLDGDSLITLSQYQSLMVWDVKTGQPTRSLNEHTSWVMQLDWSPDGSMLAQGAEDGEIIVWEAASGTQLMSLHDSAGWVSNLAWSPDGKKIAEAGGGNAIKIWDVQTGQQVQTLYVQSWTAVDLAWSPDGRVLASITYEGTTNLWDAATGEELRSLPENYGSADLTWSPQGDRLSTSYPYPDFNGEQVTLWDPQTSEMVLTKKGVHDVAWSPLGDIIASISDNGTGFGRDDMTVVLWDPHTGNDLRSFNTGTLLTHIDWSPDGTLLVVSGAQEADYALIVLDAQSGEQLHLFKGHYEVASAVAWSPRGDFIASASPDGTVIIWRVDP